MTPSSLPTPDIIEAIFRQLSNLVQLRKLLELLQQRYLILEPIPLEGPKPALQLESGGRQTQTSSDTSRYDESINQDSQRNKHVIRRRLRNRFR